MLGSGEARRIVLRCNRKDFRQDGRHKLPPDQALRLKTVRRMEIDYARRQPGTFGATAVWFRGERKGVLMPRLPRSPNCNLLASPSEGEIKAAIDTLCAARPLTVDEVFAEPIVQTRIGALITRATSRRARSRRRPIKSL
jgi:hypothetical protein